MQADYAFRTEYCSMAGALDGIIDRTEETDYGKRVESLVDGMRRYFPALTQDKNPVIEFLHKFSSPQLRFIIEQYTVFSNAAIHMFLEARIRNGWASLTEEIVRNMNEEMGVLTAGIPHLELMRRGYLIELGIETDAVVPTAGTHDFIRRMNSLFCSHDNTFLAGALLAFEATAVEEFRMVATILRRYKGLLGGAIEPESLTGRYIAGHVAEEGGDRADDPEMEHHLGMVKAIGDNVVGSGGLRRLSRGFLSVCLELNRWWEQVALEAFQNAIRERLMSEKAPDGGG
jgi:hypothetical protein